MKARLVSVTNLAVARCNSDKAQYADTPVLQHSVRKESRTRTITKRLVSVITVLGCHVLASPPLLATVQFPLTVIHAHLFVQSIVADASANGGSSRSVLVQRGLVVDRVIKTPNYSCQFVSIRG
jgi:hypothetical protein